MNQSSLIIPIFDLGERTWLSEKSSVTYRNTMLGVLYPTVQFAIGDVSGLIRSENDWEEKEVAAVLDAGWDDYRIVGASGSRKKGRVLFAKGGGDYFTRFFGSNSNAINYGSNLTTECRRIIPMSTNILIVNDGVAATGDCHATASAQFFLAMGVDVFTPFQFRMVDPDGLWGAKGTVAYNPDLDRTEYNLAIPRSAFKGNDPGESGGRFVQNLLVGLVHLAEVRRVKMSYSVTQFLPWSVVEKDILPETIDAAVQLSAMSGNPGQLAEYLVKIFSDVENLEDLEEESEVEQVPALTQIVAADKYGQLTSHPWVVDQLSILLRKRWLNLALAGAARFNSSMVMPDEALGDGEVCIPGVPDGTEVILFPYPCRWQWDLAVWTNRALPKWQKYTGVIVANAATQLTLGRDSDGDYLQWLPAPCMPAVTSFIKRMEPAPELTKPAKQKVAGSLGEIAVRAMNNGVGLITYHIAKAQALGKVDVIPQLAQQLQIEVDSLKNVQRADWKLIDRLCKPMKSYQVSWLGDRKKKEVFRTRLISAPGQDTISKLASVVSQYWIEPKIRCGSPKEFAYLFPSPDSRWIQKAEMRYWEFIKEVDSIKSLSREYSNRGEKVPEAVLTRCRALAGDTYERWTHLLDECPDTFKAASAIWRFCHITRDKITNQSFAFLTCLPEILGQLATLQVKEFPVWHVKCKFTEPLLTQVMWNGQYKKLVARDGTEVGDVPAFTPLTEMIVQLEEHPKRLVAVVVGEDSLSF